MRCSQRIRVGGRISTADLTESDLGGKIEIRAKGEGSSVDAAIVGLVWRYNGKVERFEGSKAH